MNIGYIRHKHVYTVRRNTFYQKYSLDTFAVMNRNMLEFIKLPPSTSKGLATTGSGIGPASSELTLFTQVQLPYFALAWVWVYFNDPDTTR